jgi:hypothetical protein
LLLAAKILALGDVDHFLCNDAGLSKFILCDGLAIEGAPRLRRVREIARQVLAGDVAIVDRLDRPAFILLHAAAFFHPFDARTLQALFHIGRHIRIGVRTRRVIDRQRRLARRCIERDLAQRNAQVWRGLRLRIDLARGGQRTCRDFRGDEIGAGDGFVHAFTPERKPK